ncbi:MAG: MATE family efflux transporter, partial [Prevotella sp.]|nr:MATE family efflux transporter [Prevotella sp.]
IRSIINIFLSFVSTRIVLEALGQNDFGIYSLVAGVITMLGFLSNAMLVSTQRFLSFLHGQEDYEKLRAFFANSLMLHFVMGAGLTIIFVILEPLIMDNLLVISEERLTAAKTVYYIVACTLLITFITTPFRALFIARENIVFISIVDILDGVLKLTLAYILLFITYDRLAAYAFIILLIMFLNLIAFTVYAKMNYQEACIIPNHKEWDRNIIKKITGFTGWTVYSMGCILGRVQGVAILLNRAYGTLINSAYGIAIQVSSAIQYIATSIQNAMSPQIIKAEGRNNRQEMLRLTESTCKFSFLLLAIVVIPVTFEMQEILNLWLKDIPNGSVEICRCMLLTSLVDQITIGLGIANQAIGRIRNYSLCINTIKFFTLPIVWLLLYYDYTITHVLYAYIALEFICAITRIPFLHHTAGLNYESFIRKVLLRVLFPTLILIFVCTAMMSVPHFPFRFLLTCCLCVITSVPAIWYLGLEKTEKEFIAKILKKQENDHY